MSWNLEGMEVTASYLETYKVTGRVEMSRVAYGGRVHHTIVLNTPVSIYGTERDRVIVEHGAVESVRD